MGRGNSYFSLKGIGAVGFVVGTLVPEAKTALTTNSQMSLSGESAALHLTLRC